MAILFNIIIIVGLIAYLFRRRSGWAFVVAICFYATAHGGYAIFHALGGEGAEAMIDLHIHSRNDINIIGAIFLTCCWGLLLWSSYIKKNTFHPAEDIILGIGILSVAFLFVMSIGSANLLESRQWTGFWGVVKSVSFSFLTWILALTVAMSLGKSTGLSKIYMQDFLTFTAIAIFMVVGMGCYEIYSGMVWAGTGDALRASALLFNPNVLGVWVAMVLLELSFLMHSRVGPRLLLFVLISLVAVCLVLSGSRTGLFLAVVSMTATGCFLTVRDRSSKLSVMEIWAPFTCFLLSLVMISVFLYLIRKYSDHFFWTALYANCWRFISAPGESLAALWMWLDISGSGHPLGIPGLTVSPATMESINGRLRPGLLADNSFASIYSIGRKPGILMWLSIWIYLTYLGIKALKIRGCNSTYALMALGICFFSCFFLRGTELFPLWILMAVMLGLSIRFWAFDSGGADGGDPA